MRITTNPLCGCLIFDISISFNMACTIAYHTAILTQVDLLVNLEKCPVSCHGTGPHRLKGLERYSPGTLVS
jgi:hypothetical protein